MFWGQPYCKHCGYRGPNFMWSWHHGSGVGVLLQVRESLTLRVIHVPDPGQFTATRYATEGEAARACEEYVASTVAENLRAGERRLALGAFVRTATEGAEPLTELACPACRSLLCWRDTGIS
jgi:hypothetical protein